MIFPGRSIGNVIPGFVSRATEERGEPARERVRLLPAIARAAQPTRVPGVPHVRRLDEDLRHVTQVEAAEVGANVEATRAGVRRVRLPRSGRERGADVEREPART